MVIFFSTTTLPRSIYPTFYPPNYMLSLLKKSTFVQMMISFATRISISRERSHLWVANLSAYANGILLRKSFPGSKSSRLFPIFSSIRLSVSDLMFVFLIYLELSFMQGHKCGSILILLHADIQFDHFHLLNMLSLSSVYLCLY